MTYGAVPPRHTLGRYGQPDARRLGRAGLPVMDEKELIAAKGGLPGDRPLCDSQDDAEQPLRPAGYWKALEQRRRLLAAAVVASEAREGEAIA